jgi:hypothetical protein
MEEEHGRLRIVGHGVNKGDTGPQATNALHVLELDKAFLYLGWLVAAIYRC